MGVLNFQTSRKTFTVNGKAEISFDPADINFVHRLFSLMERLEKQQREDPAEIENVFEEFAARDKAMRAETAVLTATLSLRLWSRDTNFLSATASISTLSSAADGCVPGFVAQSPASSGGGSGGCQLEGRECV